MIARSEKHKFVSNNGSVQTNQYSFYNETDKTRLFSKRLRAKRLSQIFCQPPIALSSPTPFFPSSYSPNSTLPIMHVPQTN